MASQWIYLVVAFYVFVTSSTVLSHPGNAVKCHRDELSDVKGDGFAPPTEYPSAKMSLNEAICSELCRRGDGGNACQCDWPPLKKQILFSLKSLNKERPLTFMRFPTPEDDPVCRMLCPNGDGNHFCLCN